jgi:SAM-dependent methyltransferase
MNAGEPARLVRRGYDRIADAYLANRRRDSADVKLLVGFLERLPPGARVLDAGCGAGQPIAALLAARVVTIGLDLSQAQVRLARAAVPAAGFLCGDMATLPLASGSFDAVCSYYAIIHIARDRHAAVLAELRRVLRPGGLALLCMGAADLPEGREDYLGVEMYWSHFDAATNLRLLANTGFEVLDHRIVADESDGGGAGHLFVLARAAT